MEPSGVNECAQLLQCELPAPSKVLSAVFHLKSHARSVGLVAHGGVVEWRMSSLSIPTHTAGPFIPPPRAGQPAQGTSKPRLERTLATGCSHQSTEGSKRAMLVVTQRRRPGTPHVSVNGTWGAMKHRRREPGCRSAGTHSSQGKEYRAAQATCKNQHGCHAFNKPTHMVALTSCCGRAS